MTDETRSGESDSGGDVVPIADAKKRRSGRSPAAPYQPPALPAALTLTDSHLEHLATSGLDRSELDDAQVYSATDRLFIAELLGRSHTLPGGDAIVFPFIAPDEAQPYAYRVRPDLPRRGTDNHVVKYDQASRARGVGNLVYFPPRARSRRAYRGVVDTLYTVEGEKKALVLDQLGYATVGLTGVWNWLDGDRDKRAGDTLHPLIVKHVTLKGRRCVIVFDQDARSNVQVMRAARRLAGAYYASGAAEVLFVCPPEHQPAKGVDDYLAANGVDALRALLDQAEPLSPIDPAESRDRVVGDFTACAGAPVADTLVIPRGYAIAAETGLVTCSSGDRTVEVSSGPILLVRSYVDHVSGEEYADVTFRRRGAWTVTYVPRRALVDSRAMVTELGPRGAPVHSGNSKHLVTWFARMEQSNELRVPYVEVTDRTGWRGVTSFMLDVPIVGPGQPVPDIQPGRELRRVSSAFRERGTLDGHLAALRTAWDAAPCARLAICAALAAPLLRPLAEPGFAVHLYGDTNTGKSTMLKVAASVYGDPDDTNYCSSWNVSTSAAELRAAMFNDLPQFYDEIGVAAIEQVQRLVYEIVNGEGRSRSTRDSTRRDTARWRTVVVSTGENTLASETMASGAQARVLDIRVPDFGALQGKHLEIARMMRQARLNAGCAGRAWLEALCAAGPAWWEGQAAYLSELRGTYAAANNARTRELHYLALLQVVEVLAQQHFGFSVEGQSVGELFDSAERREAEPAAITMAEALEDWLFTHKEQLAYGERLSHGPYAVRSPLTGKPRLGIRIHTQTGELVEVLLLKTELQRLCKDRGQSYHHVMRSWADRGWVVTRMDGTKRRFDVLRTESGLGRSVWIAWLGRGDPETAER